MNIVVSYYFLSPWRLPVRSKSSLKTCVRRLADWSDCEANRLDRLHFATQPKNPRSYPSTIETV
jgi:hypothetical protein